MGGLTDDERRAFERLTQQWGPVKHPQVRRRPRVRQDVVVLAGVLVMALLAGATGLVDLPWQKHTRRLLPVVVAASGGSHAFTSTHAGRPVTWNPCEPIRLVTNLDGAPPHASEALTDAMADISRASGLMLSVVGQSTQRPGELSPPRLGAKAPPVLVAWSDERESAELKGSVAGYAQPASLGAHFETGQVVLDKEDAHQLQPGSMTQQEYTRIVLTHELGHLLGLAHVQDPHELMYPTSGAVTRLGPGDLAGLAELGQGTCT